MLISQAKELRTLAGGLRKLYESGANLTRVQVAGMTTAVEAIREAADTIESLRDRLQKAEEDARIIEVETSHIDIEQGEIITRFVPAELDYIEDKSRWNKLFGTPERAARTLEAIPCGSSPCSKCPMFKPCCGDSDVPDVKEDENAFYDALLEWLIRSDA